MFTQLEQEGEVDENRFRVRVQPQRRRVGGLGLVEVLRGGVDSSEVVVRQKGVGFFGFQCLQDLDGLVETLLLAVKDGDQEQRLLLIRIHGQYVFVGCDRLVVAAHRGQHVRQQDAAFEVVGLERDRCPALLEGVLQLSFPDVQAGQTPAQQGRVRIGHDGVLEGLQSEPIVRL